MMFLKQSTTVTIKMGPFLDKTDGVAEEIALSPGVEVSKNGAAFAARSSATATAHDAEGWYAVELNATDTGTLGRLQVKAQDSATHLPVWHEFTVVPANSYDSLVAGTDTLQADVAQWLGAVPLALVSQLIQTQANQLGATAKTDVNAQVVDVLKTDTLPELPQAAPPATPTFEEAVMLLYMALRNKVDVTSTLKEVHNDAGAVIAKKTLSDDGTTYSEAEMVSGP